MRRCLVLLLCALTACAPAPPSTPLDHAAYVWQRQWTPALSAAVRSGPPRLTGWRVLGVEIAGASTTALQPDLAALASSARPVRAVLRIEGAAPTPDPDATAALLLALTRTWRAGGVAVDGIEVDHDCASARLADYAQWLRQFRSGLEPDLKLSITALPTWIGQPALADVLTAADESVLQVHAVARGQSSLFDARQALDWARAYAKIAPHPFRLALPAYSLRVALDDDARPRAVDAEVAVGRTGANALEMRSDPVAVAHLLDELAQAPPPRLAGIAWFRLPLASDRRSWSPATFASVLAGDPLQARFAIEPAASGDGAIDLVLVNRGNLDAPAPAHIALPANCASADALAHYRLLRENAGLRLERIADDWLRAGEGWRIGWARCEPALDKGWDVDGEQKTE